MEYIGNWHFWLAVIVVVFATHLILTYVMPKLSVSGSVDG